MLRGLQHNQIDTTAQRSPQRLANRRVETSGRKEWAGRWSTLHPFAVATTPRATAMDALAPTVKRQGVQPFSQRYARTDAKGVGNVTSFPGFGHAGPGAPFFRDRAHGVTDRVCDPILERPHDFNSTHARPARLTRRNMRHCAATDTQIGEA